MLDTVTEGGNMLDFDRIVGEVCGEADSDKSAAIVKTASRNHYEWSLANGMRTGDRVRLEDGREGTLTAPFPGCRGDGDWCGVFLDNGSEENIRPDRVVSVFGKAARPIGPPDERGNPRRPDIPASDSGRSVRYVVQFSGHGTDRMSAEMTKNGADGTAESVTAGHDQSSKLLRALVEFGGSAEAPASETGAGDKPVL